MCPTSNLQTGAAASIAEHPIGLLTQLRFRVTVNTDNRLMSGTSHGLELQKLVDTFGYGAADLRWFTVNAMKSAFLHFDQRLDLIESSSSRGTPSWGPDVGVNDPLSVRSGRSGRLVTRSESAGGLDHDLPGAAGISAGQRHATPKDVSRGCD